MSKKRRLGRGLSALINDADTERVAFSLEKSTGTTDQGTPAAVIPLDRIIPNRFQPRRRFDPDSIAELAVSLESQGLIQPVVVNERDDGKFELISGERRFRAAGKLGWKEMPAVVRRVNDAQLLEMTLVENLQREDLDPIEEAEGYRRLTDEFSLTQAQVAERVGKDRATVANTIRLLKLPEVIRQSVSGGDLSAGHARQLLAVDDEAEQIELARRVIENDISVRKLEIMVRERNLPRGSDGGKTKPATERSAHIEDLENKLRRALNTQVRIRDRSGGKGRIEIEFYSYEEFERLMEMLDVPLA